MEDGTERGRRPELAGGGLNRSLGGWSFREEGSCSGISVDENGGGCNLGRARGTKIDAEGAPRHLMVRGLERQRSFYPRRARELLRRSSLILPKWIWDDLIQAARRIRLSVQCLIRGVPNGGRAIPEERREAFKSCPGVQSLLSKSLVPGTPQRRSPPP